ncbi:MAG: TetR/AcrR family transcriptional regulator [Gordonia sp. (in: high G+C Gram-positive bacteria)]
MTTAPKEQVRACRPLRADAERNRLRIIEAARELFARRGLNVSLDEVAETAGVGVGTVYRRFANRDELVAGVLVEHLKSVAARTVAARDSEDPWAGIVELMEWTCQQIAEDRGLAEILLTADHSDPELQRIKDDLDVHVRELLTRAQQNGQVRPDLEWTDMFPIFIMLSSVASATQPIAPGCWRRYMGLILDAMRNPAARGDLGAPPLTDEQSVQMRRACGPLHRP